MSIYKVLSPSNKIYIGQTKNNVSKRWSQHVNESNSNKEHCCRALNAAIKKYGPDSFKLEIIWQGLEDELNEKEKYYIEFYNSMYPNGYNLTLGGKSGGCVYYDESLRQKISDNHRKSSCMYHLPIYVRYFEENNKKIFKIQIPGNKHYSFSSSKLTVQEKYDLAMEKYIEIFETKIENKDLPKYIYKISNGYRVFKPYFQQTYFIYPDLLDSDILEKAINYLNTLK